MYFMTCCSVQAILDHSKTIIESISSTHAVPKKSSTLLHLIKNNFLKMYYKHFLAITNTGSKINRQSKPNLLRTWLNNAQFSFFNFKTCAISSIQLQKKWDFFLNETKKNMQVMQLKQLWQSFDKQSARYFFPDFWTKSYDFWEVRWRRFSFLLLQLYQNNKCKNVPCEYQNERSLYTLNL